MYQCWHQELTSSSGKWPNTCVVTGTKLGTVAVSVPSAIHVSRCRLPHSAMWGTLQTCITPDTNHNHHISQLADIDCITSANFLTIRSFLFISTLKQICRCHWHWTITNSNCIFISPFSLNGCIWIHFARVCQLQIKLNSENSMRSCLRMVA